MQKYKTEFLTLTVAIIQSLMGIASVMLFPKAKVEARILSITIVSMLAYCGLGFVQIRKDRQSYSRIYWKYALRFNIPLIPHYLSQTVLSSSDRIMIAFTPEIIAIFAPEEYAGAVWTVPPVSMTVFFMYTIFANFSFYYAQAKAIAITSWPGQLAILENNAASCYV